MMPNRNFTCCIFAFVILQIFFHTIDVFRNRLRDKAAHANPLRKQYYEKRDDSDKLKLDSVEEDL